MAQRGQKPVYIAEDKQLKAVEDYANGVPVSAILEYLGVSAGRFYTVLNEHGVDRSSRHSRQTRENLERLTLADKLEIIRDREEKHLTIETIYYKWDINKNSFYTIWEQRNRYKQEATQLDNLDALIVED